MSNLSYGTWIRLIIWLAIGLVIYFSYSIRHSKLRGTNELQSTHIPLQEFGGDSDIDINNTIETSNKGEKITRIKFNDDLEEISLT